MPHYLDVVDLGEHQLHATAERRMVVGDQHGDHVGVSTSAVWLADALSGSIARTSSPPSARLAMVQEPPSSAARSVIDVQPTPAEAGVVDPRPLSAMVTPRVPSTSMVTVQRLAPECLALLV